MHASSVQAGFVSRFVAGMERHQVPLYVGALGLAVVVGLLVPGSGHLEVAIEPVLGLLLFATFLAVPFRDLLGAFSDRRFLGLVGLVNFVIVPVVVFGLSRFVAGEEALLIGVLLVLLTPCIDYVIAFAGLAGGDATRLLAAAPLLMIAQMLLLPVYLLAFAGPSTLSVIDVGPFVRAFVVLIVLPLLAALVVQLLAPRFRLARAVWSLMSALMVPLMMATLFVVVASQIRGVGEGLGSLLRVVPLYVAFVVIMVVVGVFIGRRSLPVASARALVFSGVTRNSLVVLPLALALPASLALAPLVVVTQTLVELVAMVVLVRLVPVLLPDRAQP